MPTNRTVVELGVTDDSSGSLPVRSNAKEIVIQASGSQNAGGNSAAVSVGDFRELLCYLEVTAIAGATLNVFIDSSDDGGTTWFAVGQLGPVGITALPAQNPYPTTYTLPLSAPTNQTGDTVRARWTVTGGTVTFAVKAVEK